MRRSRISRIVALSLVLVGTLERDARADDVYLKNGRSFEGVIVTLQGDEQVRIRLPFGELGLSSNLVDRIVHSKSSLERFLRRRQVLVESSASAEQWLELALWAQSHGLDHGYREAVLTAAAREPLLQGLGGHMRGFGYALDRKAGLWVPYSRLKPRPKRAVSTHKRAEQPVQSDHRVRETDERLDRVAELMIEARLLRLEQQSEPPPASPAPLYIPTVGLYPIIAWNGWTFPAVRSSSPPPPRDPNPHAPITHRPSDPMAQALLRRQPGSLIPVSTLAR